MARHIIRALGLFMYLATSTSGNAQDATSVDVAGQSVLLSRIDAFGFEARAKMGIGGLITSDIFPIVLFSDGTVLREVTALSNPEGILAHKRANPKAWTTWRRTESGELQINRSKGWTRLPFQTTYQRLPQGFVLSGRYRALSGTGTLAVGGSQEVTVVSEYTFSERGEVSRSGAAGSRTEAGETSTSTSVVAAARRGHYTINGLLLDIVYNDGTREQRILIADPERPKAIWLDGRGYVRR